MDSPRLDVNMVEQTHRHLLVLLLSLHHLASHLVVEGPVSQQFLLLVSTGLIVSLALHVFVCML